MTYKILEKSQAENLYAAYCGRLREGNGDKFQVHVTDYETDTGKISGYTALSDQEIADVVVRLQKFQNKYPKVALVAVDANSWEAEAACVLHQAHTNVHSSIITNPGYWRWLALVHFSSIIDWRYGCGVDSPAGKANYGIGSTGENLLYRLWLRGDIGYSESDPDDPYKMTRSGQLDFWRSHIQRQGYANARPFAHALLRFQYPKGDTEPRLKTDDIRELVTRLRRLRTNLLVELLDYQDCFDLIKRQAELVVGRSLDD